MRFGVAFVPAMPAARVVHLAVLAESLGYTYLFLPDQTFYADPFVLLALCASATTHLTLGLAVTNPYSRHPVQIARSTATVSQIAEGRFILGIGAGNVPTLLGALGMKAEHPLRRVREAIVVIRALLAGERVTHESESLHLRDVALEAPLAQAAKIFVGTRGPRMLEMAGGTADGVLMEGLLERQVFALARGRVEAGAGRAGRGLDSIQTAVWQGVEIGDEARLANSERLRDWAGLLISSTDRSMLDAMSIPWAVRQAVDEAVATSAGGSRGRCVPPEAVSKLLLLGDPSQMRTRLMAASEYGVPAFVALCLGDADAVERTLVGFAGAVMGLMGSHG